MKCIVVNHSQLIYHTQIYGGTPEADYRLLELNLAELLTDDDNLRLFQVCADGQP
jgi:hypothetical protein